MSAWDISGAVVWGALAALSVHALFNRGTNAQGKIVCLLAVIAFGLPATFCVARLLGAHA